MTFSELDGTEQGPGRPLRELREVPISAPYLARITSMLSEHGATLSETRDVPDAHPPYKEYTIQFPAGTVRSDGLILLRSCSFVIRFPDGFEQHGREHWPLEIREDDRATIVLYLPPEETRR